MRPEDRERIQVEVVSRIVDRYVQRAQGAPDGYLETQVNDTVYHERRRLEHSRGSKAKAEAEFYEGVRKRMSHGSERDLRQLIEEMSARFAAEVVGNFDERVYKLATSAIPAGLWGLLNAMSPQRLLSLEGMREGLGKHLRVEGEVEHVKALLSRGTLIKVPTHSSNLDSILIGYATYLLGLPPLTYGAGLNLFSSPLLSFFMRNLGAYKVDRRKKAALYKEVLKVYATCAMEMGYHNLFFPGGTRSRSGEVERKLKRGLLGTGLTAYVNNLVAGRPQPNLYVVPCTLSYKLVLEAETLIDDHLQAVGKSRYIIEDDEFSRPRQIYDFFTKLISMDAKIVVTYSAPMDIFGNRVDRQGNSYDARGRQIDISRYVSHDGAPAHDPQRDAQYTTELAGEIGAAFLRDNVIHSTNLVASAVFNLLRRANPELDLYRLLRTGGHLSSFAMEEVHAETERVLQALRGLDGRVRLDSQLTQDEIPEIVNDALRAFGIYHTHPAAERRGDRVFHTDRNLLLYYSNRLRGYDLGRTLGVNLGGGGAA
jgi:glycerol-3-phosphate O-acyltransferase